MQTAQIKIPAELFALAESSHFEGVLDADTLSAGPDEYRLSDGIAWSVDVTNTGEALLVEGSAKTVATTACSRCLEDVTYDLDGDVEGYFLIEPSANDEESDEEEDFDAEEFDVLPESHIIDLEPLIMAGLLMDVPNMPLCRDDCKGLCPRCGANLNDGPCGCDPAADDKLFEEAKNPFSVLKDFKFDN